MPEKKLEGIGYAALGFGFLFQSARAFGLLGLSSGKPAPVSGLRPRGLAGPESVAMQSAGGIIEKATTHEVGNIRERVAYIQDRIRKDSLKPEIRERALAVLTRRTVGADGKTVWTVPEKDYEAEIRALFAAVRDAGSEVGLRYTRDHLEVDQYHSANKLLQLKGGDCFVRGTLVLRDDHQLVPVESLRVGDRIWGKDRWSTVTNTWEKGILPTWRVRLNNGSSVRLTPDHKVWVARCEHHVHRTEKSKPCSCTVDERTVSRVHVRELQVSDVLIRPDRIPYGRGEQSRDLAYLDGVYLSDGWCERAEGRFAISGKDGQHGKRSKAGQKEQVKAICEALGLHVYWHKRYVRIHDRELTARMSTMGAHAWEKRALSLDLGEAGATGLLAGILADAGVNTQGNGGTFTTTSRALFVQTRVLAKMAGITCGERYLVDHGGLGTHPVWRLQLWGGEKNTPKLLRVTGIDRDDIALPCFDFETDDHYVWLPEADWTTSQCDDGSILLGSLLRSVGYPVRLRVIQDVNSSTWSHIYVLVGVPPQRPSKWIPLDWSVPGKPPGWEAPGAKQVALSGKPSGLVKKLMDFEV